MTWRCRTRRRWEVEARLLAGQTNAEIADRLGLGGDTVEAYEAIFFAVRDRLAASDWVAACLLGVNLFEGFDAADSELVMKILGYHGGPFVLDAYLDNQQKKGTDPELAVLIRAVPHGDVNSCHTAKRPGIPPA